MTRQVICRRYKTEMEGLDRPPFPGPEGEAIHADVSRQAWQDWLQHQTRLINEKRLNLMSPETRQYLADERAKFLSGQAVDQPEGYVPPAPAP